MSIGRVVVMTAKGTVVSVVPPTPGVPTGVTASGYISYAVVQWDQEDGTTSFNVYRSTSSTGTYALVGSTNVSDPTPYQFTDNGGGSGLAAGTYYYKVSAVNSAATVSESAKSAAVSCAVTAPTAPANAMMPMWVDTDTFVGGNFAYTNLGGNENWKALAETYAVIEVGGMQWDNSTNKKYISASTVISDMRTAAAAAALPHNIHVLLYTKGGGTRYDAAAFTLNGVTYPSYSQMPADWFYYTDTTGQASSRVATDMSGTTPVEFSVNPNSTVMYTDPGSGTQISVLGYRVASCKNTLSAWAGRSNALDKPDGVMMDSMGIVGYGGASNTFDSVGNVVSATTFWNGRVAMAQAVKQATGFNISSGSSANPTVMVNGLTASNTQLFAANVDYYLSENGIRTAGGSYTTFPTAASLESILAMYKNPASLMMINKLWGSTTATNKQKRWWMEYCSAVTMLGMTGTTISALSLNNTVIFTDNHILYTELGGGIAGTTYATRTPLLYDAPATAPAPLNDGTSPAAYTPGIQNLFQANPGIPDTSVNGGVYQKGTGAQVGLYWRVFTNSVVAINTTSAAITLTLPAGTYARPMANNTPTYTGSVSIDPSVSPAWILIKQ